MSGRLFVEHTVYAVNDGLKISAICENAENIYMQYLCAPKWYTPMYILNGKL
jgi:hypothetical protein